MHRDLTALASQPFDVLVIGGGIHGAWTAWRAQASGLRVALIEQGDFGAATSANSLKILHGGLRYLQHLDLRRMRGSIRARRAYARQAPHLVEPLPCLMPLTMTGIRSPWVFGPALLANDLVGLDRNAGVAASVRLPHSGLLGRSRTTRELSPLIAPDGFAAARWWDAVATDSARLVLMPLLQASDQGAAVANHVRATDLLCSRSEAVGVEAVDLRSGRELIIRAAVVVDATGPWAGLWPRSRLPHTDWRPAAWLGAVNVVLRRSLGIDSAIALSSPTAAADDSALLKRATRELFFVPWRQRTMIGTQYHGVDDVLSATGPPADVVRSLIDDAATAAPRAGLSAADISRVHWGLLPAETGDPTVPRKSAVVAAGREATGCGGLIAVIGEKFTSAPTLSHGVLKHIRLELHRKGSAPAARTVPESTAGRIAASRLSVDAAAAGMDADVRERLRSRYGAGWSSVAALGIEQPELLRPIVAGSGIRGVEVVHAIRHEMALTLGDLLSRRLGFADLGRPDPRLIDAVCRLAASEFGWSEVDMQRERAAFDLESQRYAGSGRI